MKEALMKGGHSAKLTMIYLGSKGIKWQGAVAAEELPSKPTR